MTKLKKRSGFTLAELLIVVAIIAILVAIGVPAFSTAMERSRETVDLSNIRGAYAEYMAETLGGNAEPKSYDVTFKQRTSGWIVDTAGFAANLKDSKMPDVPGAGEGKITFSYANNTDEKPTCVCTLGSGGSGGSSGSGDPNPND